MDRPFEVFDNSNQPKENSLKDVFAALSNLETVTEAMATEELDGDLADLIRADRSPLYESQASDYNNNSIPGSISHLVHEEVRTSEQERRRLYLRSPQFLPSFESFQRSVKQASVEGFGPNDLMNIPEISHSSEGQPRNSDESLISMPSQIQNENDQLVNINQRQFSGGSGQVKSYLTTAREMSRPGTPWVSPSTSQSCQSNKLQSRPEPPPQGNTCESYFSNQSFKAPHLPTTIPRFQTSTPGVGPSTSTKQTKPKKYSHYEHASAKGNPPNINSLNVSSSSSVGHDSYRPGTPWIGSRIQHYQLKHLPPYHHENKTKVNRTYPNQPYKGSVHSASTSNLVNALRGNSGQTIRHQNYTAVNNMGYQKGSSQTKAHFYKKPYCQAERVMDGPKEVELRKRLAAPNIYSVQGANSSKMLYTSTRKPVPSSTVTSSNKSLPRGYTHMTVSTKSNAEKKTVASYIDLTEGNAQNNTGFYKQQIAQKQNNDEGSHIVKTEKRIMAVLPTKIDSLPKNKHIGTDTIQNETPIYNYNGQWMGYERSQQINAELNNNNDNSRNTYNQSILQNAIHLTSRALNQNIGNTGVEQNNVAAIPNQVYGNESQQNIDSRRWNWNTTNQTYPNYAYQSNYYDCGANAVVNYCDAYQNYAGQSNASGYIPNGNSWNNNYGESNTYDQSKNFPSYSSWTPNSGWYQQNNDYVYNASSVFQQANQMITANNSLFPVHHENNLHMNIYNFSNQQAHPHQEAWTGQTQPTPDHGANSAIQNSGNVVESNISRLNQDILDLDQHQKQQRNLLMKIGLTKAIYNNQNSTEAEKQIKMTELLASVFDTPDGTNIVRALLEEHCRRIDHDVNSILEPKTNEKQD